MTNQSASEVEARWIASGIRAADLDNPAWLSTQSVAITLYWSGQPAPATRHAEARLLWSNEALHVRFVGKQSEPLVVSTNPQTEKKTIGLWDRDVCEIFIAPDAKAPEHYFEFEAAPTGEWLDLGINWNPEQRETDWEFDSGMTVAAGIEKDRIVIAMRIPWSHAIPKPQAGERWRANLFRCVGTGETRYLAWQPTQTGVPNFHIPDAFGWLSFV